MTQIRFCGSALGSALSAPRLGTPRCGLVAETVTDSAAYDVSAGAFGLAVGTGLRTTTVVRTAQSAVPRASLASSARNRAGQRPGPPVRQAGRRKRRGQRPHCRAALQRLLKQAEYRRTPAPRRLRPAARPPHRRPSPARRSGGRSSATRTPSAHGLGGITNMGGDARGGPAPFHSPTRRSAAPPSSQAHTGTALDGLSGFLTQEHERTQSDRIEAMQPPISPHAALRRLPAPATTTSTPRSPMVWRVPDLEGG